MRRSWRLQAAVACGMLVAALPALAALPVTTAAAHRPAVRAATVCFVPEAFGGEPAPRLRVCDRILRGKADRATPAPVLRGGSARPHSPVPFTV